MEYVRTPPQYNRMVNRTQPSFVGTLAGTIPLATLIYDASNSGSITSSGGNVSAWASIGSNGLSCNQSTAGNKPLTGTDTINSLNAIRFTAASTSFLQGSALTLSQPYYIVAVVKYRSTGLTNSQITGDNGSTGSVIYQDSSNWSMYAGTDQRSSTAVDTNAHCVGAVFNGAASSLRLDGTALSTGVNAGGNQWGGQHLNIGASDSAGHPLDADIGELRFYSGLTVAGNLATIQAIDAALKAKWATP